MALILALPKKTNYSHMRTNTRIYLTDVTLILPYRTGMTSPLHMTTVTLFLSLLHSTYDVSIH